MHIGKLTSALHWRRVAPVTHSDPTGPWVDPPSNLPHQGPAEAREGTGSVEQYPQDLQDSGRPQNTQRGTLVRIQ